MTARKFERASEPDKLQSVTRALAVLDVLATYPGGATPKAVAAELGLRLGTTYHLLNTLLAAGYATRCAECRLFRLGPRIPIVYRSFVASINPTPIAVAVANALQQLSGETASACRLVGDDVVVTHAVEGTRPAHIGGAAVGMSCAAHGLAAGRVLLAWQSPARIDSYLSRPDLLARVPPPVLNDPAALRSELARIREAGFTMDRGEIIPQAYCIAAPLGRDDDTVAESLAVMVSRERFEQDRSKLISTVLTITGVASRWAVDSTERRIDAHDMTAVSRAAAEETQRVILDAAYPLTA